MCPVWSPDGSKIAVTTDNYTGILVADANGGPLRVVCDATGAGYKMMWSDDSRHISGSVRSTEGNRVMREIRTWDVSDGSSTVVAARSRNTNSAPTLRQASRKAAATSAAKAYEAMTARPASACAETSALARFEGRTVINPALSPDGSKVAFQIPGQGMWLLDSEGRLSSLGKGSHPSWLPDSRTIVYTIVEDDGARFTASTLMSLDTANPASSTSLTRRSSDMIPMSPSVSPDGKKVVFENAADAAIYVVNLK